MSDTRTTPGVQIETVVRVPFSDGVAGPGRADGSAELRRRGDHLRVEVPAGGSRADVGLVALCDVRDAMVALAVAPPRQRPPTDDKRYAYEHNWYVFACPGCGVWASDAGECPGDLTGDPADNHAPVDRVAIPVRAR